MLTPVPDAAREGGGTHHIASTLSRMAGSFAELSERIRLLEAVVENFPGGISLFDTDLKMVLCNQQQRTLLDYPETLFESGMPTLEELFRFNAGRGEYGPGDVEEHVRRRMVLVRECEPHVYERTRPNGRIVEVRGVPLAGGGFLTTYFDVTEQRQNQELIAHMAHHDPLTDLPNRILFSDRLQNALALAKRGGMMAVHYLDMDHFKPVNDEHGHEAGDDLLKEAAARMSRSVREHDTVARLGGDEFAIVQTGIGLPEHAASLARRLLSRFGAPFDLSGSQVSVSVSIGIALAPLHGVTRDELLRKADSALYASKSAGRGRYSFFEDAA